MDYENNDQFWLKIIMIFYVGFGSVVNFIGNVAEMHVENGFLLNSLIFISAISFPIIGITSYSALKRGAVDGVYLVSLYLVYNGFSALVQLAFLPLCIDIACFLYFHTSGLIEYLFPHENWEKTKRFYVLSCLAVVGFVGQIMMQYL